MRRTVLLLLSLTLVLNLFGQGEQIYFSGTQKTDDVFTNLWVLKSDKEHFYVVENGGYSTKWELKSVHLHKFNMKGKKVYSKRMNMKFNGETYYPQGWLKVGDEVYIYVSTIKKKKRHLYLAKMDLAKGRFSKNLISIGEFKIVNKVSGFESQWSANKEYLGFYFEQENKGVVFDKNLKLVYDYETDFKIYNPKYFRFKNDKNFFVRNDGAILFYQEAGKKSKKGNSVLVVNKDAEPYTVSIPATPVPSTRSSAALGDVGGGKWAVAGVYIAEPEKVDIQGVYTHIYDYDGKLLLSKTKDFEAYEFPFSGKRRLGGMPHYGHNSPGIDIANQKEGDEVSFDLNLWVWKSSPSLRTSIKTLDADFHFSEDAFQKVHVTYAIIPEKREGEKGFETLSPFSPNSDAKFNVYKRNRNSSMVDDYYIIYKSDHSDKLLFSTDDERFGDSYPGHKLYQTDEAAIILFQGLKRFEATVIVPEF